MRWAVVGVLVLLLAGVSIALLGNRSPRQDPQQETAVPNSTTFNRPLRVGIVSWPGYAGGIVANNGFKANQNCLFWKKHNLEVEFVFIEDVRARNESFMQGGEKGIDLMWSTVDSLARDLPVMKDKGIEARAIMQVDWSRGGDAIVADQSIKRVADLKGKKISLALFTPSHWLLEHSLESSGLSETDQAEITKNLVGRTGSPEALTDFLGKQVDAAVLWEPDISDALKQRPGAHVLVSTKTEDNLIADILVAREDFITAYPEVINNFAQAWLEGTKEAYAYPDFTINLLMDNDFSYKKQGAQNMREMFQVVKLADLADNAKMFGLDGNEPLFDQIFKQAGQAWAKRGYINQPANPEQAKSTSFLKNIYAAAPVTKSSAE
jgi:ABC-type nitrate/sulfonate/bicarbonate transport system substrate-binding protein